MGGGLHHWRLAVSSNRRRDDGRGRSAPVRRHGGSVLNLGDQVGAAPRGLGFPIRPKASGLAHPSSADSRPLKDDIGSEFAATNTHRTGRNHDDRDGNPCPSMDRLAEFAKS